MIVTREEAITIIDSLHLIGCGRNQHEYDLKINVALDMAIEALSEPHWIPISERLPNDQELVNVTVVDDHGDNEWRYTTTAWRSYDMWVSDNELVMGTVVAWAPLPKPYERNRL